MLMVAIQIVATVMLLAWPAEGMTRAAEQICGLHITGDMAAV